MYVSTTSTLICISLLFLLSCTRTNHSKDEIQKVLDTTKSENLMYSDINPYLEDTTIFDDPKIIFLETNLNSLVNQIEKILIDNTSIFVLDTRSSKVFKFNDEGGFVKVLNKKGKGPREYRGIIDFAIDKDKEEIYVLCEFPYKIYVYNYSLDFVREIKTNDLYLELAVSGQDIYCRKAALHNNKQKKYHVDVLDKYTGEIKNNILPIHTEDFSDYEDLQLKVGNLLTNHGEVLISLPERNHIYSLKNESHYTKYTFQQLNIDDAKGAYNLFEQENYLVFINNDLLSIYDKVNNTLIGYRYGIFNYSRLQGTVNRLVSTNLNNGLILIAYPNELKTVEKNILEYRKENKGGSYNKKFLQFSEGIGLEDNPILFIYNFK